MPWLGATHFIYITESPRLDLYRAGVYAGPIFSISSEYEIDQRVAPPPACLKLQDTLSTTSTTCFHSSLSFHSLRRFLSLTVYSRGACFLQMHGFY